MIHHRGHRGHREYLSLKHPYKQEIKTLCPLCPLWWMSVSDKSKSDIGFLYVSCRQRPFSLPPLVSGGAVIPSTSPTRSSTRRSPTGGAVLRPGCALRNKSGLLSAGRAAQSGKRLLGVRLFPGGSAQCPAPAGWQSRDGWSCWSNFWRRLWRRGFALCHTSRYVAWRMSGCVAAAPWSGSPCLSAWPAPPATTVRRKHSPRMFPIFAARAVGVVPLLGRKEARGQSWLSLLLLFLLIYSFLSTVLRWNAHWQHVSRWLPPLPTVTVPATVVPVAAGSRRSVPVEMRFRTGVSGSVFISSSR